VRIVVLALLAATLGLAADVAIYTPQELETIAKTLAQKPGGFGSQELKRYGNYYMMLAHREATGSSELHEKEADVFFVTKGSATIITGGQMVNAKAEKPGELRGTSIKGGERHELAEGSVITIPAGTAHQLLITKGNPFTYFVVKVIQ
jgi:mannose-6-phosphate isomerase-like protein (cupin superfamily)